VSEHGGPFLICSFKVEKETASGHVTVKYRTTNDHKAPFRGVDGKENSPGFVILTGRPAGIPEEIPSCAVAENEKVLRDLAKPACHVAMASNLHGGNNAHLDRDLEWIKGCVINGEIPVTSYPDGDRVLPGNMGMRADISIHPERDPLIIEYIKAPQAGTTKEEFWQVPDRALRPEYQQRAVITHDNRNAPARLRYDRVAHRSSSLAALQPLGDMIAHGNAENNVSQAQRSDPEPARLGCSASEPAHEDAEDDDAEALAYRSESDQDSTNSLASLPSLRSLVGKLVYLIDDGTICKGIVDSMMKKGKCMIKFQDCFLPDTRKPLTYSYDRSELFPNRLTAQRALDCESTSESDGPSDERRGYQKTKALKDAERKTRAAARRSESH
jgi:hypothetical protein